MSMNISGPPWVVSIPEGNALSLTAAQVQQLLAAFAQGGHLGLTQLAAVEHMASFSAFASSQSAVSTSAVVPLTPAVAGQCARLSWVDLKRPVGSTTDATGYAAGAKTITLASAGTGAFYAGDVVTFAGQSNEYTLLSGDSDVSNGGTITLAGYGLFVAIAASATAITLVRRGAMGRIALNCDNDVEGLKCSQDDSSRDASVRLGETVLLRADVDITQLHVSANVSVLANAHRLDAHFGD